MVHLVQQGSVRMQSTSSACLNLGGRSYPTIVASRRLEMPIVIVSLCYNIGHAFGGTGGERCESNGAVECALERVPGMERILSEFVDIEH